MSRRLPRLCTHAPTGQYYIRIRRQPIYLGKVGGPEAEARAEAERLRILDHWQRTGRLPGRPTEGPTVNVLIAAFLRHAATRYVRRDGRPSSELACYRMAVKPLQRRFGPLPVADFTPLDLEAVGAAMADGSWMSEEERERGRRRGKGAGWCRNVCNRHLGRLRRLFRWGVKARLVPLEVWQRLATAEGVRPGQYGVRETGDVPPAPEAAIAAVRERVLPTVRDMIDTMLLSGARPGEVCAMRPMDFDFTGERLARLLGVTVPLGRVWAYLPGLAEFERGGLDQTDHKTAHHGHRRVVPIGPKLQEILRPYLEGRAPDQPLFSPREAKAAWNAERRRQRKTKVPPSQLDRSRPDAKRRPGDRYTVEAFAHAIARACKGRAAGPRGRKARPPVPHWHPHQLRHNAATRLEREFGLRIAQIVCGHRSPRTTLVYVQRDLEAAFRAMEVAG
jgi:integrase